jgi:hypothetical protein
VSLFVLTGSAGVFTAIRTAATLAGAASVSYAVVAGTRRARGALSRDGVDRGVTRPTPAYHAGAVQPPSARLEAVASRKRRCASQARAVPDGRWELGADLDLAVATCGAFLDTLEALPRDAWLEIGRRTIAALDEPNDELTAAIHALEGVIVVRRARVTAWLVRDAIRTSLELVASGGARSPGRRPPPPSLTTRERHQLQSARDAAEHAALAQLVRPWLTHAHHRALVGPFASIAVIGTRDR